MLFLLSADYFYEILKKYHQSVKQFGSRSGLTVGADLGSNYLQWLSDDTSWQRVNNTKSCLSASSVSSIFGQHHK